RRIVDDGRRDHRDRRHREGFRGGSAARPRGGARWHHRGDHRAGPRGDAESCGARGLRNRRDRRRIVGTRNASDAPVGVARARGCGRADRRGRRPAASGGRGCSRDPGSGTGGRRALAPAFVTAGRPRPVVRHLRRPLWWLAVSFSVTGVLLVLTVRDAEHLREGRRRWPRVVASVPASYSPGRHEVPIRYRHPVTGQIVETKVIVVRSSLLPEPGGALRIAVDPGNPDAVVIP